MPATSVSQRRFFGMVSAGKIPRPKGMTESQVEAFASTKEAGLPDRARNQAARRISRRLRGRSRR